MIYRNWSPLKRRIYEANKRAKRYKAKGRFTARNILSLYERQGGKCALCEVVLYGQYEIDHIKPLSKRGCNYPHNLQLLCPKCNKRKGDTLN